MFEKVPQARQILIERGDGVDFIIPSRKNIFVSAFLTFWLGGWALGEISALGVLFFGLSKVRGFSFPNAGAPLVPAGASLFMIFWLGAWTVGGACAIYYWLWLIAGREIISASSTSLSLKKAVFGFGRTRNYDASEVRNLRLSPAVSYPDQAFGQTRSGSLNGGRLAFDYGARTFRFGSGLDDAEAVQIIERMKMVLPAEHR